jgi:hypothetical protein
VTVAIAAKEGGEFVEVYREKYVCRGRTLKGEERLIDVGALPCRLLRIEVSKGCRLATENISLVGVDCREIEGALGADYFRLLVLNPMKIVYPNFDI